MSLFIYCYHSNNTGCHVHDPSAIAYVIDPTLFTIRKGAVRVVCDGPASGMTLQKSDNRQYQTNAWSSIRVSR
ncbi:nucleoside hydrolase [Photobacterium aquimaris]|uniref:nucleoside hydrolase n=1 Tax=Photobacterium aquimaris TaxID=512643 RepID=UPI00135638B9